MPQRFVPADYDPAKLQVLQRAFDVAWAEVAQRYSPENAEAARGILAQAVVAAASEGIANIDQLRDKALRALDCDGEPTLGA
jgi:hypothetical protein